MKPEFLHPTQEALLFWRGNHEELLRRTFDSPGGEPAPVPWMVGALVFLGRLEEARACAAQARGDTEQVACGFFLGIGETRRGAFLEARRIFAAAVRAARARPDDAVVAFFAFQGVAFFRFFGGRYHDSLRWGKRALSAAIERNFIYGKILANDMIGHALCLLGHFAPGQRALLSALDLAGTLGNGGIADALRCALSIFRARTGTDLRASGTLLSEDIANLKPENTYSLLNLQLELARVRLMQGQAQACLSILDGISVAALGFSLHRQEILWSLVRAEALRQLGDAERAMEYLLQAESLLHRRYDESLVLEVRRTRREFGLEEGSADPVLLPAPKKGENPLAELVAEAGPGAAEGVWEKVLASGAFSLLRRLLPPLDARKRAIVLGLPQGRMAMFSHGDIHVVPQLPRQLQALFSELLSMKILSHEELVVRIWGVASYHPLRHDAQVYRSIGRLRQHLSPCGAWIQAAGGGYRWDPGVAVFSLEVGTHGGLVCMELEQGAPSLVEPPAAPSRAEAILELLRSRGECAPAEILRELGISKSTLSREMSALLQRNQVSKVGNGKGIRYRPV